MDNLDLLIAKLVASQSQDEKLAVYQQWSTTYDEDLIQRGYIAPARSVELFKQYIQTNHLSPTKIYDAGCGTGKVGALLALQGFQNNIHGADYSPAMLQVAECSQNYQTLQSANYLETIKVETNSFAAAICVGVYSREFSKPGGGIGFLSELVRIVGPNGIIVFTCRPTHYENYCEIDLNEIINSGTAKVLYQKLETYMTETQSQAWYIVLQVSQSNSPQSNSPPSNSPQTKATQSISTQPITLSPESTLSPLPLHERVSILLHAYLKSLSDRSHPVVSLSSPPELQSIFSAAGIPCPLPSNAQPHTDDILMEAVKIILQKSVRTGHPQFYNQLFGRVNLISLAGDWISTATNTNGHTFEAAPVATLLEAEVLLKFATVIGGNYVEQGHDGLLVC